MNGIYGLSNEELVELQDLAHDRGCFETADAITRELRRRTESVPIKIPLATSIPNSL